jgi:hypothetical protein
MATFGTFVGGQVLTAAELNSAGVWETYTPTWTQDAAITKTVNWARYTVLNKWVQGSVKMTASSAGTTNNIIKVGLPVSASSNNFLVGTAICVDESVTPDTFLSFYSVFDSATTLSFTRAGAETDATLRWGQTGSSSNIVIASGDIIYVQFAYEAA